MRGEIQPHLVFSLPELAGQILIPTSDWMIGRKLTGYSQEENTKENWRRNIFTLRDPGTWKNFTDLDEGINADIKKQPIWETKRKTDTDNQKYTVAPK